MWRTVVAGLLLVGGIYWAVDALIKTEPEVVEDEMERLVILAREGGEEAAEEILDAFATEYRGGAPYFDLPSLENRLRTIVGGGNVRSLETGGYKAIWTGDEITIPILAVTADVGWSHPVRTWVAVVWTKEGDRWKIANITRVQMGR